MPTLRIDDFSRGLFAGYDTFDAPEGYFPTFRGVARFSSRTLQSRAGSTDDEYYNASALYYYIGNWYYGVGSSLYRGTNFATSFSGSGTCRFAVAHSSPLGSQFLYVTNGAGCRAVNSSTARQWGIAAPTNTPTGTAVSGGSLTASSVYRYAYTFYNSTTGCESNPSGIEIVSTTAGNTAITLTGLSASSDSQVTHKRIYRSLANDGNLYYLTQITYTQSSLNDYASDGSLYDTLISYDNGMPGNGITDIEYWNNNMFWLTTGGFLYYSRKQYPESVAGFIHVGNSADSPRRLVVWGGDLYIIAHYNVYQILNFGDESNVFMVRQLKGIVGTKNPETVVTTPKGVVWQSYDGIRIFTGGSQSSVIGEEAVRSLFLGSSGLAVYTNRATYAYGEYIIGNTSTSYGINLESGKFREIGARISAIHHDPYANETMVSYNSQCFQLENMSSGSYYDGGTAIIFKVRTHVHKFESAVRIEAVRVVSKINGTNLYSVALYTDFGSTTLGNLTNSAGIVTITDFDVDLPASYFQLEFYCSQIDSIGTINYIEVDYEPLELRIAGDNPTKVPAYIENDHSTLAFNFRQNDVEEAGVLYKYEMLSVDYNTGGYASTLYYHKVGGAAHTVTTLTSSSRDLKNVVLNFMGPMERFHLYGSLTSFAVKLYDMTVYRSMVKMRANFGSYVIDVPAHINETYTSIRFRLLTKDRQSLQEAYLYERLTIIGNPSSNAWNVYIDMLNESAELVETESTTYGTTFQYSLDKMGVLDEIYLSGTFSDGNSYLHSAELTARPITLVCNLGDSAFEVPGRLRDVNTGIIFDFQETPLATLNGVWYFDRLIYEVNTDSNNFEININFSQDGTALSSGTLTPSGRAVGSMDINKIGRVESVEFIFDYFNDAALYQVELVANPFTLDLYLDEQKLQIPGYKNSSSSITFDLNNAMENSLQQAYLFETMLIEGDTDSHSVSIYKQMVGEAAESLFDIFSSSTRDNRDSTFKQMGRLDKVRLSAAWAYSIAIHKFEIVAHAVKLDLWINGQLAKQIPGRLRAASQYMYFDFYPYMQESLQTSYVVDRFFYDITPGGTSMSFDLQIQGVSDLTGILTSSSSSRVIGEVNLTKPGRLSNLTIGSNFKAFTQVIHKLEIHVTATNRYVK